MTLEQLLPTAMTGDVLARMFGDQSPRCGLVEFSGRASFLPVRADGGPYGKEDTYAC